MPNPEIEQYVEWYKFTGEDEPKKPIRIERLSGGGFLVMCEPEGRSWTSCRWARAFTDAFDMADWLLAWLGFDEGLARKGLTKHVYGYGRAQGVTIGFLL